MVNNISKTEKQIRIGVGIFLILAGFYLNFYTLLLSIVGIVLILTGLINWCPMYAIFGISTHKK
jgi:uncharacterized membrane protein